MLPGPASAELPAPYASLYTSTAAIFAEFASLASRHPSLLSWTPPGAAQGEGGDDSLGVATFAWRGDNATDEPTAPPLEARPVLLLVFGEHAREIITSETALWLARALVGEAAALEAWPAGVAAAARTAGVLPQVGGTTQDALPPAAPLSAWSAWLLRRATIVMVPVEVPAGREAVMKGGELCRRKTVGAEVDLNRNWGAAWRAAPHRGADEFGGAAPFSEPASKSLRSLAERLASSPPGLAAYANSHSGEWAMYVPWDHKASWAAGLGSDTVPLLEALNVHCGCTRGPGGAASSYLAFGTSMDWMWQQLGVRYSLTFELYGTNKEGKRPADWVLPPTPTEPFEPVADTAPRGRRRALASFIPLLFRSRRAALADAQPQPQPHAPATQAGLQCLSMFNPSDEGALRDVLASWVHTFLLLTTHVIAHTPPQPGPSVSGLARVWGRKGELVSTSARRGGGGGGGGGPDVAAWLAGVALLGIGVAAMRAANKPARPPARVIRGVNVTRGGLFAV